MSHIVAVNKTTGKEIMIVDAFITNVRESLKYWSEFGMSHVIYKAKKVQYIPKDILNYNI